MSKDALPLILCFGDSLTAGYQSPTVLCSQVRETPYGRFLQDRLGRRAQVAVSGLCGETTDEMGPRFRRDVERHRPIWAVILGGTNDLGGSIAPTDIMDNLTDMYEWALAQGIRPVAVTVPSVRLGDDFDASDSSSLSPVQQEAARWVAEHIARRRMLNRLMMDYCGRRGMACIDLFADTAEPDTGQLAALYSNDGLHLTTDGYRRLADLLYEQVFGPALRCS